MKNEHQPAFPLLYDGPNAPSFCNEGLTKREYFAAMAMQGLLSNSGQVVTFSGNNPLAVPSEIAKYSIEYADELLKQLEQ